MKIKTKSLIFTLIILILTLANSFFLIFSFVLFPVKGGYTRQILFVKPNDQMDQNGYFIILDELAPESRKYNIDWLLHSRGDLIESEDGQSVTYRTKSYTTEDEISLNVEFLEKIDEISEEHGVFCPENYRENDNYPDLHTSYVKARYSGKENPIMATILYPKNDSDVEQEFPTILKLDNNLRQIGDSDFLFYQEIPNEELFYEPDIQFHGRTFFIRKNQVDPGKLEFLYLQKAKEMRYKEISYFSSKKEIESILCTYSNKSQISGYINGKKLEVSIYCPFNINHVKVNDISVPFNYSNSMVSFSINKSSSFLIAKTSGSWAKEINYLIDPELFVKEPSEDRWRFDNHLFNEKNHPYILFNSDEITQIRNKINNPDKPWHYWYEEYIESDPTIPDILKNPPTLYEDDQRYHNVYKLAMKFIIEKDNSCLSKLKTYLSDMDSITHYSSDLRRAKNVQAYAIAYDIIYSNLTVAEQQEIYEKLYEHSVPLMRMDLYHRNNHRVVDAGALGCAGLVLKNKKMIDLSIDTALDYFYNQNPADGGSFEGYSYIAFAIRELSQFAIGLRKIGGFDFYQDNKFIATLDYIGETLGPIGMPGSFEDCTFDPRIQESLIIAAAQVNEHHPEKAQNYQYIWEQREKNANYPSASTYGYIKGENPSFRRILCYNVKDPISPKPYTVRKEVWNASSMAYLRHGGENGLFMPFSCKNYDQNHPHQDENSFELWAFGSYLVNNPGYPGWGKPYHTWSQSTEGANSLLIGGNEQLQVTAGGLQSSISSPYFSTVTGDATEIYNDAGAYIYVPEFYLLLLINFILLLMCSGFYYSLIRNSEEEEDIKKRLKEHESERDPSRRDLAQKILFHPYQAQDAVLRDDLSGEKRLFINRVVYLMICGSIATFFLISCFDVNSTIVYHSQYHEDKYNLVFEVAPFIIFGFFTLGTVVITYFFYSLVKLYSNLNELVSNQLLNKRSNRSIGKSKIRNISNISFFWMFPVLLIAEILIYITTVQALNSAIHGLWTELNSINDVYTLLVSVLIGLLRNFVIILLIGSPFLIMLLKFFGYGIEKGSQGVIRKKEGIQISFIGLSIILIIIFLLFSLFYIIFKSIFSLISIELIVN
ncbi:MAG: membrane protein of unknown function [Promethearchaeota archaeon]|nr:MAG: membrane protein of unknown function [Candidatus Lokiarchaeota archaeon]